MVREAKGIPSPKRVRMGGETAKRRTGLLRKRRDRQRKRQAVKRACSNFKSIQSKSSKCVWNWPRI